MAGRREVFEARRDRRQFRSESDGRRKGASNKATHEAKAFASAFLRTVPCGPTGATCRELTRRILKARLLDALTAMGTPIDFPELEHLGVLKRIKHGWYLLLKREALPDHAWTQANGAGQTPLGDRLVPMLHLSKTTRRPGRALEDRCALKSRPYSHGT